mgnify:CR=1 FL=1
MRVALITGMSSGIGLATTRAFLRDGIAVVGVARVCRRRCARWRRMSPRTTRPRGPWRWRSGTLADSIIW